MFTVEQQPVRDWALRFGEYQHWRWPWRGQDRTLQSKERVTNISANGMFSELGELK